jgi:DNA-binding transcriptional ArsR family regulator
MLRTGEMPAGEVARRFRISRPAVSKHLRVLRRARLVAERREGRQRVYELNAAPLTLIEQWLRDYRPFWRTSLGKLKRYAEDVRENEV